MATSISIWVTFIVASTGIISTMTGNVPLNWNSLIGVENLFPANVNIVTKMGTPEPPGYALMAQLESILSNPSVMDQIYQNYLIQFEKTADSEDPSYRQSVLKNKLLAVAKHNLETEAGLHKWTKGVNQFSDLTEDEFHTIYTLADSPDATSSWFGVNQNSYLNLTNIGQQSDTKDWRQDGAVTPVKNQGGCGSCYAFASIAVAESLNLIRTGQSLILSEQELVDCSGNKGCRGGNSPKSWNYMKNGISLAADYPYTSGKGKVGQCQASGKQKYVAVNGWEKIAKDEDSLAAAVEKYGPVSILINSRGWSDYGGGIYEGGCGQTLDGKTNHLVTVVGYTPEYFIIKNSWGTRWGDQGFMQMQRGQNLCDVTGNVYSITS